MGFCYFNQCENFFGLTIAAKLLYRLYQIFFFYLASSGRRAVDLKPSNSKNKRRDLWPALGIPML